MKNSFLLFILLLVCSLSFAQTGTLIHSFDFNNTLLDTKGTGVSLEVHPNTDNATFGNREWSWTADSRPGGGLLLKTSTLADPQNYSVGFRVKYTDVTGRYKKLLSFKGKTDDNGLYFHETKLVFYPFDANDHITYHSNTFYDFIFSRSSNDSINVYIVDDVGAITKIYSEHDATDASVPALIGGKYEFGFFMDDETAHTEYAPGGTVRGIRVWNYPLKEAEIGDALSSVSSGTSSRPTLNGVTLTGTVDPKGIPTDVVYEYGPTTTYGSESSTLPPTVSGDGDQTVTTTLSGLTKGTEYHYRIKATEQGAGGRTFYSTDRVFRTLGTFVLQYNIQKNGTLTGTARQPLTEGDDGTEIIAVSDPNYHFVRWSDGMTTASRIDTAVRKDLTVVAEIVINSYPLTYTTDGHGTITGDTVQTITHGGLASSVTAVAKTGYEFEKWTPDDVTNVTRTDIITGALALQANFRLKSYRYVYKAGVNGSIGSNHQQTLNHFQTGQAVTAIPDAHYHFVQWSDGSTDNPRTDVANGPAPTGGFNAEFAIDTNDIDYAAGFNGSLTGTVFQTLDYGSAGTVVTAVADLGYHFVQWDDGNTDNPRTDHNVITAATFIAEFTINTYTLTYVAGANGSLSGTTTQSIFHGENGTDVLANPNPGYHFDKWADGNTDNPRTSINVTATATHTAQFVINTYSYTYTAGSDGSISGTSPQSIFYGTDGTPVTANADPGFKFDKWSDDLTDNPRTETNVTADGAATALFVFGDHTLDYTAGANGTLTGDPSQSGPFGFAGTTVTAVPNGGFHFVKWDDGLKTADRTDQGIADISVIAEFHDNVYTLTYTAGANGGLTGTTSQNIDHGRDGTAVEAVPNANYHFTQWDDGNTDNPRTDIDVLVPADFIAQFELDQNTLNYFADVNGKVTGNATQEINYGFDGSPVLAEPNNDYHFLQWDDGNTDNPRLELAVIVADTYTAQFEIDSYTIDYTAGVNGSLSGTLSQVVDYNTNGTAVTATAATGYHFVQWDDGNINNPRTDYKVNSIGSFVAQFAINKYTIYYIAEAGGSLTGLVTQVIDHGSDATIITATPNTNHHFVKWSDGILTLSRTDLSIISDATITAEFAIDTKIITYLAGVNGSITGDATQVVDYRGSSIAVEAVPDANYHFVQWDDGAKVNPRSDLNLLTDYTTTAEFALDPYSLTFTSGAGGVLAGDSVQSLSHGADATTITATPNANYHFVRWTDGSIENPRTDLSISVNITAEAEFAYDHYIVTYSTGANGSLQGYSSQSIGVGFDGTAIEAIPDGTFHFAQWSDGSTDNPRVEMNVTADITVSAEFSVDDYSVTYATGDGGSVTGTLIQTVAHGMDATEVVAVPDLHWYFTGWSDGNLQNPRHDLNIKSAVAATATFSIGEFNLNYSSETNGILFGDIAQLVLRGESGTLVTAEPNFGYLFDHWSDGHADASRVDENIKSSQNLLALFVKDTISTPVHISEGFSPNGDGINDTWNILFIEDFPSSSVKIISRSGAVVYEKAGYQNNDGFSGIANVSTIGTNQLPEGTYFYVIDLGDGTKTISGYFTLLR